MAVTLSKDWLQGPYRRPGRFPMKAKVSKKKGTQVFPSEKKVKRKKKGAIAGMLGRRFGGRG